MSGPAERPAETLHLGPLEERFHQTLEALVEGAVADRIWRRDHLLWSDSPSEIADRLGWLSAPDRAHDLSVELRGFVNEIEAEDIRDVVLLGMGGSSLGAECLRRLESSTDPHPRLHVLDSTVPARVESVIAAIDLQRALFLVASKSGTTIEVISLFEFFWQRSQEILGDSTGGRFVAITDAESPLAVLAETRGFRRSFHPPSDIGGRFSVLTAFGLLPAALLELDIGEIAGSASYMADRCRTSGTDNPGLRLAAQLVAATESGRHLLTFLTSPRLDSFGLWAEQLIAESTGKNGQGIVPIVGEPALPSSGYGSDRLFVVLRLEGDANEELDARTELLRASGHPTLCLEIADPEHIGAEFFRWQFAIAATGHQLGVQPFDQPDVEATKRFTQTLLVAFEEGQDLPRPQPISSLADRLAAAQAKIPSYVALMAYTDETPEFETAVEHLRRELGARGLPTTFGYGPRFLHSTGQLHKAGPKGALFVQLLATREPKTPIPGRPYDFATLAGAQALGDWQALERREHAVLRIDLGIEPARRVHGLATDLAAVAPEIPMVPKSSRSPEAPEEEQSSIPDSSPTDDESS